MISGLSCHHTIIHQKVYYFYIRVYTLSTDKKMQNIVSGNVFFHRTPTIYPVFDVFVRTNTSKHVLVVNEVSFQ